MSHPLDLSLEQLDSIEVPVSYFTAGLIVGAAFGVGVVIGAAVILT